MKTLFGLRGQNFTLVASDLELTKSVIAIKHDDKKHYSIWNNVSIGYSGEQSSASQLLSFVRERMKFEHLRNKVPITARVTANLIRKNVHGSLRRSPFGVGCLVGDRCSLFAVDVYGAMWETDYASLGYAQYFLYGLLDSEWRTAMSAEEGFELAEKCASALKDKFVLGKTKYNVQIVSDTGIEEKVIVTD